MAFVAAALVLGAPAGGPGFEAASASPSPVRIGVYQNLPKIGIDASGRPAGLFVELIQRIGRDRGWQLEFVRCEWRECLVLLERGEIDLMPDVALTRERRERFAYHDIPVVQSWSQFFASPQQRLGRFEDLEGLRVAVMAESVQETWLVELRSRRELDFAIVTTDSLEEAFERVESSRADAAVANNFFGQVNAARFSLVERPVTFNQVSLFYAALPERRALLDAIDVQLARWKADRESPYYEALVRAFSGDSTPRLPAWALPALSGMLATVLVLAGLALVLRWRVGVVGARLRATHGRLERLLDSAPTILYSLAAPQMTVEWVSPNVERIMGFPPDQVLEPGWWRNRVHPDDLARVERENARLIEQGSMTHEYRILDADGRERFVRDDKRLTAGDRGEPAARVVGTWTDMTAERTHARRVDFLANYDQLTGLANRSRFDAWLARRVERQNAVDEPFSVVVFDLDRFKSINEAFGSEIGDQTLVHTARRLIEWSDGNDRVARLGNDEFAILTDRLTSARAREFMDELRAVIDAPVMTPERELLVTASIGTARFPEDGRDPATLMRRAQRAVRSARQAGGGRWVAYRGTQARREDQRLFLESDLRQAIADDRLVLYFQPQVRITDQALAGAEALLRWPHPEHGLLAPGAFIPLAEETGLIERIDPWVIERACRHLADWASSGRKPCRVSVNVSAGAVYDESLPKELADCVARHGVDPALLVLELTETQLMRDPDRALDVLQRLREIGVGIALDDFGTGYSNLAYLNRLPLDQIKMDRSLIQDLTSSDRRRKMVRALAGLVESLELELVAEGVETRAELELLREIGFGLAQGFLIARPMPEEDFRRRLES